MTMEWFYIFDIATVIVWLIILIIVVGAIWNRWLRNRHKINREAKGSSKIIPKQGASGAYDERDYK